MGEESSQLRGQSTRKSNLNVYVRAETRARLGELARDADMAPTRLAAELLEELVPTITGVRRRLQVTRAGSNGSRQTDG